jgi:hypothetical protein
MSIARCRDSGQTRPSSEVESRLVSPYELYFNLLEGGVHVVAQLARARGDDDVGGGRCAFDGAANERVAGSVLEGLRHRGRVAGAAVCGLKRVGPG